MNSTYYPQTNDGRADWWQNILDNSSALATLGFTAAESTSIKNDAAAGVYLYRTVREVYEDLHSSVIAYADAITGGNVGADLPDPPTPPAWPEADRLMKLIRELRSHNLSLPEAEAVIRQSYPTDRPTDGSKRSNAKRLFLASLEEFQAAEEVYNQGRGINNIIAGAKRDCGRSSQGKYSWKGKTDKSEVRRYQAALAFDDSRRATSIFAISGNTISLEAV